MNIFVTSPDPVACAKVLDDKRLVKMVLETAQLLCTCHNILGTALANQLYKTTHINHPCAVWVRQSKANYDWTVRHLESLCIEYSNRFYKQHACVSLLEKFKKVVPNFELLGITPFANCTEYKDHPSGTFVAYQQQMKDKWVADNKTNRPAKWTNSFPPLWLTPEPQQLNLGV